MKLVIVKVKTNNGDRIGLDYESEQAGKEDVVILDYVDNWKEGEKKCKFWSQELGVKIFDNNIEYQI